jgi:hypothetical protein
MFYVLHKFLSKFIEGQNVGVQWARLAIRKFNGGQVIKRGCEQLGFE